MPIYKFACSICGHECERIVKLYEIVYCSRCAVTFADVGGVPMERILSVPSKMQWGCKRF